MMEFVLNCVFDFLLNFVIFFMLIIFVVCDVVNVC